MKNEQYNELVNQVKNLQPRIVDSQRLTSTIMQHIERVNHSNKYHRILTIVSWSSSIAALLLIALFLFEQFFPQDTTKYENYKILSISNTNVYTINANLEENVNFSDFNRFLRIKKERQEKQRRLYSNFINKHQNL